MQNSFSYVIKRLHTRTRFETGAQENSVMACSCCVYGPENGLVVPSVAVCVISDTLGFWANPNLAKT